MFIFMMGVIMHIEDVGEGRANDDVEGEFKNDASNYIGYQIIGMYLATKGWHFLVIIEVV